MPPCLISFLEIGLNQSHDIIKPAFMCSISAKVIVWLHIIIFVIWLNVTEISSSSTLQILQNQDPGINWLCLSVPKTVLVVDIVRYLWSCFRQCLSFKDASFIKFIFRNVGVDLGTVLIISNRQIHSVNVHIVLFIACKLK